jgi:hypothetical protein
MTDGGVNEVQNVKAFSEKKKGKEKNSRNRKSGAGFNNYPNVSSGTFGIGNN